MKVILIILCIISLILMITTSLAVCFIVKLNHEIQLGNKQTEDFLNKRHTAKVDAGE